MHTHTTTAAADLTWTRQHWADLRTMLTTPTHTTTWPPAGGIKEYLASLDDIAREEYRLEVLAERAERTPDAPGERPVPIRLAILDTIRVVEAGLCGTADHLAAWQPTNLPDAERWRGRWAADTSWRHGATWACTWLTGALDWLPRVQAEQVAHAAREARYRVARVIGSDRRRDTARRACPHCSGQLVLTHGGEELPEARCTGCGRAWRGAGLAALHHAMSDAA